MGVLTEPSLIPSPRGIAPLPFDGLTGVGIPCVLPENSSPPPQGGLTGAGQDSFPPWQGKVGMGGKMWGMSSPRGGGEGDMPTL
jgi:hypothetical protein